MPRAKQTQSTKIIALPTIINRQYTCTSRAQGQAFAPMFFRNAVFTCLSLGYCLFTVLLDHRKFLLAQVHIHDQPLMVKDRSTACTRLGQRYFFCFTALATIALTLYRYGQEWPAALFFIGAAVSLVIPNMIFDYRKLAWSATSWGDHAFCYEESRARYLKRLYSGWVLTIMTLGLYYPAYRQRAYQEVLTNIRWGQMRLRYTGHVGPFYAEYALAFMGSIATLGAYFFWFKVRRDHYLAANTWLGGERIGSARGQRADGGGDRLVRFAHDLLVIGASFGFATPWVICERFNQRLHSFSFIGNLSVGARAHQTPLLSVAPKFDNIGYG